MGNGQFAGVNRYQLRLPLFLLSSFHFAQLVYVTVLAEVRISQDDPRYATQDLSVTVADDALLYRSETHRSQCHHATRL